jgi:hypothetical protein
MSDSDKIDSSHESGKNLITWAWPTSTTIIQNNPVLCAIFLHPCIYLNMHCGVTQKILCVLYTYY